MEHCLMSYDPNPLVLIADGAIGTAKLGGDVTAVAKTLLQASTEKAQRQALDLAESSTMAQGALTL
jgi:hypothetical protein